jgi:DNA-binding LytR/AlgR family response regulator
MLSILIVEDDPNFYNTLEMYLEQLDYTCVGIANSAKQALEILEKKPCDFALMDINIEGEIDGIQLGKLIKKLYPNTEIIFTTSFENEETFEIAAEVKPSAYLIKPFTKSQLQVSLTLAQNNDLTDNAEDKDINEVFYLKDRGKLLKVDLKEVSFINMEDKYACFNTNGSKILTRKSAKQVMDILPQDKFIQIHKSYIVNIDKIDALALSDNYLNIASNRLPLGRAFKDDLVNRLNLI